MVALAVLLQSGVACRADADRSTAESTSGPLALPTLIAPLGGVAVAFAKEDPDIVGRMSGDGAERVRVRHVAQPHTVERLCGVISGQVRYPVRLDGAYATTVDRPQLATRMLRSNDLVGVRFLQPGDSARYRFEGLTIADGRHISFQWPIVSDPDRPIPAGAPDSVLEGAVTPTATALDSVIASIQWPTTPRMPRTAVDARVTLRDLPLPSESEAVPLLSDLPVHQVDLESPCREATFAIPILARIDEVVRVPVQAGDRVDASARVAEGTVRVSFDEAPRAADEPRQRQSIPRAAIEATADGHVTVRIRAQVVPRAQATGQLVFLRLRRTPR